MVLAVSILIVYGITLILVQGKIFEPTKVKLAKLVNWLKNKIAPSDEYIAKQIQMDKKLLFLWNESLNELSNPNLYRPEDAIEYNKNLFETIRSSSTYNSFPLNALYIILRTLQEMLQCMMCTGFWVGLIVCVIMFFAHISIFGITFMIVTSTGLNAVIATILMAGLFSGTTWIIDTIVDLLYELKSLVGRK